MATFHELSEPSQPPHPTYRVSAVIPALNEAKNLVHVLPRIPAWVHEVILVDGNSTDGTAEVATALWPDIRIVQQRGRGKGAALRTGFEATTGDIIVMLDADGSTDPGEIPAFVGALLAGADFAKGSRFLQGGGTADMPLYRQLGNSTFVAMVRCLFGGHYTDLCYGYNAFWRSAIRSLQLDGNGFEIETMMNIRALVNGLKIAEVPSFEGARVHGTSNLKTIPDGWRVLKTVWREWLSARRDGLPRRRAELSAGNRPARFAPVAHGGFRPAYVSPAPVAEDIVLRIDGFRRPATPSVDDLVTPRAMPPVPCVEPLEAE
jgi:glycosyltransferase involved in cell wall biosynthesis